jgi:hypothetical protein
MQSPLQVLGKTSAQELNQSQIEQVIFSNSTDLTKIVQKERVGITKFTQWMETNKMCEEA